MHYPQKGWGIPLASPKLSEALPSSTKDMGSAEPGSDPDDATSPDMVTRPSASEIKRRCTSLHAWELPKQTGALAPAHVWTNKDMDPTPPEQQNWSIGSIVAYWATDVLNLSTWQTASAVLAVGLSWREAIPIMFLGNLAVAIPIVLNGAIGSKLHIPLTSLEA
ncbi:hypothetical protein GGR51DRAFT_562355 [Nemania sp. FL0031]|nr:hypothetical protein GGR51DRAFT_562355 [Nemania sp. FL0031]